MKQEMEQKVEQKMNKMDEIKIEKVVLNIGGTGEKLEKGFKLLEILSGKKPVKVRATKRIPSWQVRPGLEVGTKVTLRGKDAEAILGRLLLAVGNQIKEKQVRDNFFSFGIHEYIEIPDMEYIREVGIMGLEATVVFVRAGKRIERKKVKSGKTKRKVVKKEEIEEYISTKLNVQILRKVRRDEQ